MKTLLTWLLAAAIMTLLVIHETGMFEEHFGPEDPAGVRLLAGAETSGELVALKTGDVPLVVWASGRLEAPHVVEVFPEIGGRILELDAELGAAVESGAVIARIDPAAAENAVDQARAGRGLAESRVLAAEAAVEAAQTAIVAANVQLEHARTEAERQVRLKAKQATTDQALAAAETAEKAAAAQVAAAHAQTAQAGAEVESAHEAVRVAETREAEAQRVLSKCEVLAPIAGVVQARHTEAGSMASPGAPLVSLRPLDDFEAVAWFEEGRVPGVGEELFVRLGGVDLGRAPVTGLGTAVDPMTQKRPVKVAMRGLGKELRGLAVGSYCELGRAQGSRSLLLVPAAAVRREGQIQSVRLETERGIVQQHLRAVELGVRAARTLGLVAQDWLEVRAGLVVTDRVEVPR